MKVAVHWIDRDMRATAVLAETKRDVLAGKIMSGGRKFYPFFHPEFGSQPYLNLLTRSSLNPGRENELVSLKTVCADS